MELSVRRERERERRGRKEKRKREKSDKRVKGCLRVGQKKLKTLTERGEIVRNREMRKRASEIEQRTTEEKERKSG